MKSSPNAPTIINQECENVSISKVTQHPRNARQGDVGAIYESIKANGFWGHLIVQRSTDYILVRL